MILLQNLPGKNVTEHYISKINKPMFSLFPRLGRAAGEKLMLSVIIPIILSTCTMAALHSL